MSVISDALKEAQRERSGRGSVRGPSLLVENLFPHPDRTRDKPSRLVLWGGGTAALMLLLAGAWAVRGRIAGSSNQKRVAPPAAAVVAAPKPVPAPRQAGTTATVPAETKTTIAPAQKAEPTRPSAPRTAPGNAPPKAPPRIARAASPIVARPKAPADSAPAPATSAVASGARSAPASPPDAPVAPRTDASGVRLVIDRAANSPADSLFRLAYAEQMNRNLDGAQALYERAIATEHAPAEAYNDYGVLLLSRGNKTAATEMFRQALNRDDKNVEAWVNLGDSFNGMGYHAEAMSAYARANQLDPARAAVKTRISREYEAIGDTATARRYLEDAVKANPNDAPARYALGAYLQRAHDYQGAVREFQAFVDLNTAPDNQEFVVEMRRHINALKRVAP
ncbi:MAG: tetratricopeptide repeat protein [Gemmatimonadaceae bacterium]